MHFLDSNILLYSISTDPTERAKRECAIALMDRDGGALSVQVLQEFYAEATRPSRSDRLPHQTAAGLVVARTATRRARELGLRSRGGYATGSPSARTG